MEFLDDFSESFSINYTSFPSRKFNLRLRLAKLSNQRHETWTAVTSPVQQRQRTPHKPWVFLLDFQIWKMAHLWLIQGLLRSHSSSSLLQISTVYGRRRKRFFFLFFSSFKDSHSLFSGEKKFFSERFFSIVKSCVVVKKNLLSHSAVFGGWQKVRGVSKIHYVKELS